MRWALPALLLVVVLLAAKTASVQQVGLLKDDISYVASSLSLSQGEGYARTYSAFGGADQKYPPGYPLLLTPFQFLSPNNLVLLRSITALCGLVLLALLWHKSARYGPQVATLTGLNLMWLSLDVSVMSEIPFMLTLYVLLWRVEGLKAKGSLEMRDRLEISGLLALCIYLRSVGLFLVPAVAYFLWRSKLGWKQALSVCVYSGGLYLPLFLGNRASGYREDLGGYPGLWSTLTDNAVFYFQHVPGALFGSPLLFESGWQGDAGMMTVSLLSCLLLTILLLMGACLVFKEKESLGLEFVLPYTAIFLVWPFQMVRFFVPLLPLFYRFLLEACAVVFPRLEKSSVVKVVCGLVIGLELVTLSSLARAKSVELPESYSWISQHTEPQDVISTIDPSVWLYSDRRVFVAPAELMLARTPDWLNQALLLDCKFVLCEGVAAEAWSAKLDSHPEWFEKVYSSPDSGHAIYKFIGQEQRFRLAFAWYIKALRESRFQRPDLAAQSFQQAVNLEPTFSAPKPQP